MDTLITCALAGILGAIMGVMIALLFVPEKYFALVVYVNGALACSGYLFIHLNKHNS